MQINTGSVRPKGTNILADNANVAEKYYKATGILLLAVILLATFVAYRPALKGEMTNFDDNYYVKENPYIAPLDVHNVKNIFTNYHMGNYHPLAMISLALDYRKSALEPRAYHVTNLAFHLVNTALLFWLMYLVVAVYQVTNIEKSDELRAVEMAVITAALFGLHTIHVESVAWISERKDVLYVCFYLLALLAYIYYVQGIHTGRARLLFVTTLVFFVLSVLSKGQAVALPLSLLAIDHLMKRRLTDTQLMIEKVPFFAISIVFGGVAIVAQRSSQSLVVDTSWTMVHRLLFACYGYVMYLWKILVPLHLSPLYPYPLHHGGSIPVRYFGYPLVLLLVIGGFVSRHRNMRLAIFAVLFFTANIVLLLQLLPVGKAVMADRYAYLASIGIFMLPACYYRIVVEKYPQTKPLLIGIVVAYLGWVGTLTYSRCNTVWQNSLALWESVLQLYPDLAWAYNNRGDALINAHPPDYPRAVADFNRALALDPGLDQSYFNRGVAKTAMARTQPAETSASDSGAPALNPQRRLRTEAIADFGVAIRLRPEYPKAPKAFLNRGATWFEMGNYEEAIADFDRALALQPDYPAALANRGMVKALLADVKGREIMQQGQPAAATDYQSRMKQSAFADFGAAIAIDASYAYTYYFRGMTYFGLGKKPEGCADLLFASRYGNQQATTAYAVNCR